MFSNLRIFRDPIRPLWEVPQNNNGGKFVIILEKSEPEAKSGTSEKEVHLSPVVSADAKDSDSEEEGDSSPQQASRPGGYDKPPVVVPMEFKMVLSLMVLGLLGPIDHFCGCVFSVRAYGNMISIWTSSSADDSHIELIRSVLALSLRIPESRLSFQRHKQTISNNTRNLSKTETRKKMREARAKGDYIEPPTAQHPPRRKSESEKPVFHGDPTHPFNQGTGLLPSGTYASSQSGSSTHSHSNEGHQQHSGSQRGIHRSTSGERLGYGSTHAHGGHHQANHQAHGHTGAYVPPQHRTPTSPRSGGQSQPHASSPPQSHAHQASPTSPQGTSPSSELTWREMAAQNKHAPGKRTAAFSRSNVHFGENVSVQTYTKDAPSSSRAGASVTQARVHPPAPLIPDIQIMSGTPPPTSSMLAMAAAHHTASEAAKSGVSVSRGSPPSQSSSGGANASSNDDSDWIPAGGSRGHANGGNSSSQAHHAPFTSPRGHNVSTQGNGAKKSAAAKRRTQSASAGGQPKPDPNYVSPEALYGADLPLLSPSGTPMDSVPPSPPAELDDEGLAQAEEQRRQRQSQSETEMAQTLSTKIKQLSLQTATAQGQDDSPLSPTSPTASGSNSARRRQRNQNRRNSSNGS